MPSNFGSVLMDFYRKNPAELAAANRRVGRVRTDPDEEERKRRALTQLPPAERTTGMWSPLPAAAKRQVLERPGAPGVLLSALPDASRRAVVNQAAAIGRQPEDVDFSQRGVLDLGGPLTPPAERQATIAGLEAEADAATRQADATIAGLPAREEAFTQALAADRAQFDLALKYGTREPAAIRAAQQRERSAAEGQAAGGARAQGNILAAAAATNRYRQEPELPPRNTPFNAELAEQTINRSHREDAAMDLDRQADEQLSQGNTTEANKLRYTASRLRTQGGGIGGEAAEAMVGRPEAYRTASGGVFGGATGRGIDAATQARMDEGINLRRARGRSVVLGTEAAGRMPGSEADLAGAEARRAGALAMAAERMAGEGTTSQLFGGGEPGGPNLEAAEKLQKMANEVRERDPELAKYYDEQAINASGGQSVQEQAPGHTWRGLPTTRPVRRVVPKPAPAPYTAGGALYTSGGRMGLHTSAAQRPTGSAVLPGSVRMPAEYGGTMMTGVPAQHGVGTLGATGEPALRTRLPRSAAELMAMSDQQFLRVLRDHPGDRMTRDEAARRQRR